MPEIHRIIVGVHGSLGSLQALRCATNEARLREVPLVPVIAWIPPGGDLEERRRPSHYLRRVWCEEAWQRLWTAFDIGLGGLPADIEVKPQTIRGDAGPVLVSIANNTDDLLVIGTGRRSATRSLRRSVGRYCLKHARCPVLAVPPPELMTEVGARRRLFHRPRMSAIAAEMNGT